MYLYKRYALRINLTLYMTLTKIFCTVQSVKLTIQPLVENSIIHGFDEIEEGGMITIRVYSEDDYIFIEVADNGCGTDTDELNKAVTRELDYSEPIEKCTGLKCKSENSAIF